MSAHKKPRLPLIIAAILVLAMLIVGGFFAQPLSELFRDTDKAAQAVEDAGLFGPFVFMGLQIIQVIIAPIPGQVTGFLGGFLFGAFWGTVYSMLGAAIGFIIVFLLARKLGRPFVEYFVDAKTLKKFDYISKNNGLLVLFFMFLLPVFPDDLICYIAGLTAIPIRHLVIVSLLGRLPGFFILSLAGSGVANENYRIAIGAAIVLLVVFVIGLWQRKRLERIVRRFGERLNKNKLDETNKKRE